MVSVQLQPAAMRGEPLSERLGAAIRSFFRLASQPSAQLTARPELSLDLIADFDVDLAEVAVRSSRSVLSRDGIAVVHSLGGPALVRGDEEALLRVLVNLLNNSIRHADSRVALTVRVLSDDVEIRVEDDGNGVAVPDRTRIFERFVRLGEARTLEPGGSGLGLSICRNLVLGHRGSVEVQESELGGASFVVRLPLARS